MNDRGQTTIDFVIAITIFITAITGAILVSQAEFQQHTQPGVDHGQETHRTAEFLAQNQLASSTDINTINTHCTRAFFDKYQDGTLDQSISSTVDCTAPTSRASLNAAVGLPETRNINVTIYTTGGSIATIDGTQLTAGQTSQGEDVTESARIVLIDGERHILRVRIW